MPSFNNLNWIFKLSSTIITIGSLYARKFILDGCHCAKPTQLYRPTMGVTKSYIEIHMFFIFSQKEAKRLEN